MNWGERLAMLEVKVLHIEASVDKLVLSVENLLESMNKMSGGWKALTALAALLGGLIAAAGVFFAMRH